jgi:hypothetical protein
MERDGHIKFFASDAYHIAEDTYLGSSGYHAPEGDLSIVSL